MAKGAYVGVSGIARKIKKGYVGVGGIARRIKKAYIGVGGIARPCWSSGGKLSYFGTIDPFGVERSRHTASTVGDYAIFGGGKSNSSDRLTHIEIYDDSLVRTGKAYALPVGVGYLSATTLGRVALFAGGQKADMTASQYVRTIDESLSLGLFEDLTTGRYDSASTSFNNHALFAGGYSGTLHLNTVELYDENGAHAELYISVARGELSAISVDKYAIFAGGKSISSASISYKSSVDAFNSSMQRHTPFLLAKARCRAVTAHAGTYALVAGGYSADGESTVVDAISQSLTRTTAPALGTPRDGLASASIGEYAIFAGGRNNDNRHINSTEIYDGSLTRTMFDNLNQGRVELVGVTIGNYALFGGGYAAKGEGDTESGTVDVFELTEE